MKNTIVDAPAADLTPLCIDLDGTLIRSDLLFEALVRLVTAHPVTLLRAPAALLAGRAHLKRLVMTRADLDYAHLPVREEVMALARQAHTEGRPVHLVTAADEVAAQHVADRLGIFTAVHGSRPGRNLKGQRKAAFLVDTFGSQQFDYVGDSPVDVPVWNEARHAYVVGAGAETLKRSRSGRPMTVLAPMTPEPTLLASWWKALRPHQWTKNLLVLVPLLTSGRLLDPASISWALLTCLLFSAVASGTYVANDLLDMQSDRVHPTKRHRPFAGSRIPVMQGIVVGTLMVVGGCAVSFLVNPKLGLTMVAYSAATLAYSVRFKSAVLIDVTLLAGLYATRIFAGAVAIDVDLSFWLLAFAVFAFFSLALAKRYAEILRHPTGLDVRTNRRGYRATDAAPVLSLGTAAGVASVVILSLYINDSTARGAYGHPLLLWLIVPALLYWISRVWIVSTRGEMTDDPIVWALSDRLSLGVGGIVAALYVVARYLGA